MKRKILIFLSIFFTFFVIVNASYTNSSIKNAYNNIIVKLQSKYSIDKQYIILKQIDFKIKDILENRVLNADTKNLINYLYELNLAEINRLKDLKNGEENNDFILEKEKELEKRIKSQELKEFIIKDNLKKDRENLVIPSYVKSLESSDRPIIYLNKKHDFFENGDIKRINFTRYYNIDESSSNFLSSKLGYIVKKEGSANFWFVEEYSTETKIPYSKFKDTFSGFYSSETPFYLSGNTYYTYVFTRFSYISDNYGLYKSDLVSSGVDTNNMIVFLDDTGSYKFVTDYKKVKLIDKSILDGVSNKWYFLKELADDKKHLFDDTDESFKAFKEKTKEITSGLSDDEKIKAIYAWILSNIKYTESINLSDYRIFSGIKTFENRDGTCEGYTKTMAYMLLFAGFTDLDVIRGYVIDAPDFPQVGHAWIRVGDTYYDPTFDDPIGASKIRSFENYYYFNLPKDLFYTNRYLRDKLPEEYKIKSLASREQIVNSNIYNYAKNNPNSNYNITSGAKLRIDNGIPNRNLTVNDFKSILDYQILKDDYKVNVSGQAKTIKNYVYIPVTNENIETVFKNNFNYNTDGLFLFHRQLENIDDHVLSYDITYY